MRKEILIVGAGFSGAVLARELAENLDATIHVIDERTHVAGNCHTARDPETGVMVHQDGPHICNTDREDVWRYVQRFGVGIATAQRLLADNGNPPAEFSVDASMVRATVRLVA